MLKLGSFSSSKKVKETLTFKEFLSSHRQAGRFIITFIFVPSKYPTGAVIFETEEYKVKYTLSQEYWNLLKTTYNLTPNDLIGYEFYFVISDSDYGIERVENNSKTLIPVYEFVKDKRYFRLVYKDSTTLNDVVEF
ncbi:MAG: hypothetical protein ACP5F0_04245 [Sulfurihydrogenibium sp.]